MATVESIKNSLVDKIQAIDNKDFLMALEQLISSASFDSEMITLTDEQKQMLEMSEQDIKNQKTITQEEMNKRNIEWLDAM